MRSVVSEDLLRPLILAALLFGPVATLGQDKCGPGSSASLLACTGDCNDDGLVTIDELIRGVAIAIGQCDVARCASMDTTDDGMVTIDEVVVVVNHALFGCPPGKLVDIGSFGLWIRCWGVGGPTVVLEAAGPEGSSVIWEYARYPEAISPATRVCIYDRANQGSSDTGVGVSTLLEQAAHLHLLLGRAGIQTPIILAGHSWGGAIAQIFASTYPDEVAGLVLIDPPTGEVLIADSAGNPTLDGFDLRISGQQLLDAGPWPDVPLVVISRDLILGPGATTEDELAAWQAMHAELARRTAHGRHVIAAESHHFNIIIHPPGLVTSLILETVAAAANPLRP